MTWASTTLGEIIELFDHIRVPLSSHERAERQGSYPYYGAQGIIDYIDDYLFDGRYLLVPEDGENLNSRKLPIAFFASGRFWVNNHAHIIRARKGVADDDFLKHWLNNANISGYITGAAQPKLSQQNLRRIAVQLPSLNVQRRIAGILSAYDDLIELNMRRIAILEDIARRLFDEWFVKFETVAAAGARKACLGDLVEEIRDTILPSEVPANTPYVGLEHMPRRSTTLQAWGHANEVGSTKHAFEDGDILFGKIRPYFHKVVVAPCSGVASSDAIVMRPFDEISRCVAICLASSDAFIAHAVQTSNGTKMPRANWNVLRKYEVVLPPSNTLSRFAEIVGPAYQLCSTFAATNINLRSARDLLLSKLISGEIDLERAQRCDENAKQTAAE